MLEGRNITYQETRLAVLEERIIILLSSTNVMCIKELLFSSPSSPPPIFLWISEVAGISIGLMLDSQGCWKHGGQGQTKVSVIIFIPAVYSLI